MGEDNKNQMNRYFSRLDENYKVIQKFKLFKKKKIKKTTPRHHNQIVLFFCLFIFFWFFGFFFFGFCLFRAAPEAYGGSQARDRIEPQRLAYPIATVMPQDPSHVCDLHHSSRQCQIFNPFSKARDQTQVLMDTGQVH